MTKLDFNELERRALAFVNAGRFRATAAIYYAMGDGDPSLDAGYLAMRIGECHEAQGELHAARYWYGRAVQENPAIPEHTAARWRLESVSFDTLPPN
jgi:hypothetical protein